MYSNEQKNDENFWISYADLMAGLLFVFILVVGAIVIKYMYSQASLKEAKTNLEKEKSTLNSTQDELSQKNRRIIELSNILNALENEKGQLVLQLAQFKDLYENEKNELDKTKDEYNNVTIILNENIEELTQQLKVANISNEKLSSDFKNQGDILVQKDIELKELTDKLNTQNEANQKLIDEFNITISKIKRLTGIKLNVISQLKEKLGKSINIDEKSGAIKFSSNILFDQNEYKLKDEAKKELSSVMKKYLDALLIDDNIKQYINSITIEGHTNSDGTYLKNLELSQQRAFAVMQFLYESNIIDKTLLSTYVNSSGKSSSELVYKDGVEDKDASRRIEIKFTIKNEAAIKEIQEFLGEKK